MNQEKILQIVAAYRSPFDPENKIRKKRYEEGLQTAEEYEYVTIAINGVWGGRKKDGASVGSYEKLGFHACTADFLQGILESGVQVIDYRVKNGYHSCSCGWYGLEGSLIENKQFCPRCGRKPLPNIEEGE